MRGYSCYYHTRDEKGEYSAIYSSACWSGLPSPLGQKAPYIYIDVRDMECNDKLRKVLLPIINKITYCKKVTKNPFYKDKYVIKFALIYNDKGEKLYYRNMFLLNFVRYIWNEPVGTLSERFRVELEKLVNMEDPIEALTTANQKSYMDIGGYDINGDHSNAFKKSKIKSLKDFNNHKFDSIHGFLTV